LLGSLLLFSNRSASDRGSQHTLNRSFVPGFALPDDKDAPTQLPQHRLLASVTVDIGREFVLPESDSGLGVGCKPAPFVPMPEAPMHENSQSVFREHQVWAAWKVLPMNAEAQAHPVGDPTYRYFRSGIPTANPRH